MNKKTVLIFLGGVLSSALVFGAVSLMAAGRKPASVAPNAESILPVSTVSPALTLPAIPTLPEANAATIAPAPSASVAAAAVSSDKSALKETLLAKLTTQGTVHTVAKGESLTSIAKKYQITVGLIRQLNGLANDKLMLGQKLKILPVRFSAVVDKSQNTLILKGGEEVLKQYVVSTGKDNSTPVGVFKITDKISNPTWYKDNKAIPFGDPRNVLGTRWLGLDKKSYGIHGTAEVDKLGQQVSDGCVRMKNEEVEELFEVLPKGAEVTIVD